LVQPDEGASVLELQRHTPVLIKKGLKSPIIVQNKKIVGFKRWLAQ
jgi:hypothetical protein